MVSTLSSRVTFPSPLDFRSLVKSFSPSTVQMLSTCRPLTTTSLSCGESPLVTRHRTASSGGMSSCTGKSSSAASSRNTFVKIRLCKFYEHGLCWHGDNCSYAHGEKELRQAPDLRKTKICHQFRLGKCTQGSNCQYAHGRSELRCTREVYKTSLCRFWLKGKCGPAENCRHAHGEGDLRCGLNEQALNPKAPPMVVKSISLSSPSSDEDKTLESYNDMGTDSDDIDKLTEKLYHLIDELAGCPELKHMSTYLRNTRTM